MISVQNLSLRQGRFELKSISFELAPGEYVVLMGRTGIGKTTILEAICGLRPIVSGTIGVDGQDVTWLAPAQRRIGYVPQDRVLFPSLNVAGHLAFAPRVQRRSEAEIARQVGELADLLGIGHLLDRLPTSLSGGEAQRVALGRALAMRPAVLLFDEPLTGLDDQTREEMYQLLAAVRRQTRVTTLHITHHREEARRLGDRLLQLEDGRVRQMDAIRPPTLAASEPIA